MGRLLPEGGLLCNLRGADFPPLHTHTHTHTGQVFSADGEVSSSILQTISIRHMMQPELLRLQ